MAKKTYSKEEKENILRVYDESREAGASKLQAARNAKTSYFTIRNWLEKRDTLAILPSKGVPLEEEQRQRVVEQAEKEEEQLETTYYEFQGHLEEGKPMQSSIRPIEPPPDGPPPLDGPCLVLPNGFRVYGPFEELWNAAVAAG